MKLRDSLLTLVLGAAAGLGGSFLYGASRDPGAGKERQPAAAAEEDAPSPAVVVEPRGWRKVVAGAESDIEIDSAQPTSEKRPRVRDDDDAADEEWRARDVAKHERQPVDPVWSRRAHESFSADFARLGEKIPFEVERLDCRSSSCLAVLKYDDFAKAKRSTGAMIHDEHMGLNCMRTVFAPEPQERSAEYGATVIFDCGADSN